LDAEALQIIAIIATSRKVTCSIPDVVIGIFYWNKSPGSIMTMGSTYAVADISGRNTSWGVIVVDAYG